MITRRNLLAWLAGLLAAPMVAARAEDSLAGAEPVVIVDGWVLVESDLEKVAPHAL